MSWQETLTVLGFVAASVVSARSGYLELAATLAGAAAGFLTRNGHSPRYIEGKPPTNDR